MNEPLEIEKIWTLSTGHLAPETRKKLAKFATVDDIVSYSNDYGFFIPIILQDGWIESPERYPGELVQIMAYAAQKKIAWLHFDADGPRVPAIPYYEEEDLNASTQAN